MNRAYTFLIEGGGHIMLDQTPFQELHGGIFLYDIYDIYRGVSDVVSGTAWASLKYVGHCQEITTKSYKSTIGMNYDRNDALLLLNTAPAGTYFTQTRLTHEAVKDLMKLGLGWWWPAWLDDGRTGFAFASDTDMVAFAAVHEDTR